MISRRLIRVKVLQLLYAYFNGNNTDGLPKYEKDLQKSLEKSYDLYHLFFILLIDVHRYALDKIELRKSK
ncbi:MAG: transcription antitermination factor NusB, partial [Salinivirgaceae bacterium]|nr:transcription antitermination factor NusB [Salinivirgaceae bacterium]